MTIYAGQGDPVRSMRLLWRKPKDRGPAPGPKPALSLEVIVAAGIAVADADGVAGLSMRTVGERLGHTSMALYTYVPGKAELLDLMYDQVHAELAVRPSPDWRTAATNWATALRERYLRHPWALQVSYARPVLGPHEQAVLESLAAILFETGLPARTLRGTVSALFHYVRGAAQTAAESQQAAGATGVTDQDWWAGRSTVLNEVAPDFADRFPCSVRLARASAGSWEDQLRDTFGAGLDVLLDGVAAVSG